ncbi:MAG: ATP-grasp domain-containing protein [Clostridia bacterium]
MREINILITSVGRRVELVKLFARAKSALGVSGKIVTADITKTAPALQFGDVAYIIPRISDENFVQSLIDICNKEDIALIVPTIDTELEKLAQNKEFIESQTRAKALVSSPRVIEICNDKRKTAQFFAENNFLTPRTLTKFDLQKGDYNFPLFVKPLNGSSSQNAYKINNENELEFFSEYVPNAIIQECASGKEYTIDVFVDFDGNVVSVVPRQRLATRAGEIQKGKIEKNDYLIAETKKMIAKLKPIGHITAQGFLGQDGAFRFIEINPRFGGGAPMSILAGADSPQFLYRLLRGEKLEYVENFRDGVVFSRFDDCVEVEND